MKALKSALCLILCLILTLCVTTGFSAKEVDTDLAITAENEEKATDRYYFYYPEIWKNKHSDKVGIYWWEGTDACEWPGVEAHETEVEGVYYYDVPADVTTVIWTNLVDGGTNPDAEIYMYAEKTNIADSEFYFADEVEVYPQGVESFDGMIYVVDLTNFIGAYHPKYSYNGQWYYYYGNGEYGLTPEKGEFFCTNSYLLEPLEIGEFAIYDVNADGAINVKDATEIQRYCAKLIDFDEGQIKRTNAWVYDWDGNFLGYNVTVKAATQIQKFTANLLDNGWGK